MNAGNWLDAWMLDARYAVRSLAATPLFTLVAIATLAIGTGATTAIFSTVNATLLRPLPYPEFERLVDVRTRLVDGRVTTGLVSHVELQALARADIVAQAAGVSAQPFNVSLLRDDGSPVNVTMSGVTDGFFSVVGLPTVLGRTFTPDEHQPAGNNVPIAVVIADRAWSTLFARDPAIVGKPIRIAEMPAATIVGVAAPELDLPHETDFWFNARLTPQDETHFLAAIVRLKPGATIEQLRAAGEVALSGLRPTVRSVDGRAFVLRPLLFSVVGDLRGTLLIVLGATALLLILACVNVTNLLLARGLARTRDIALRSALGATRAQIVRQLLTESMVLALAGTLAGLGLAFAAVRLLLVLGASSLPRLERVPFDGRVLAFAVGVLLVGGLVTGAVPAWRLARPDIRALLSAGGRTSTATRGTSRVMSGLIVAEVALGIALVAGSGWLVQSFARLQAIDPGFRTAGRLVVDVRATRRFEQRADGFAWAHEVLARVRAAADDAAVGAGISFPTRQEQEGALNVELQSEAPDAARVRGANIRAVSPGFFEAMGTPLVTGRLFTDDDRQDSERVAIVNRAFVRQYFPDADPLADAIAFGYPTVDRRTMYRVVGVVESVRQKSLGEPGEAAFYLPMAQAAFPLLRQSIVIAPRQITPAAMIARVRDELRRFDPQVMLTFTEAPAIVAASLVRQRLGMTLMLIFGLTALALAAIGIYGVMAYATAQRAGEIATRLALGEAPRGAFWLVMRDGQKLAVAGLAIGLGVAYVAGRMVAANVFAMRADDPVVLLTAAVVVGGVAAIATMIPAIRASRLSPVRALRNE